MCYRYEIRDVHVPDRIQHAMQLQVEAERKKRAAILESEGGYFPAMSLPTLLARRFARRRGERRRGKETRADPRVGGRTSGAG